ncbi:GNAT family N-acetyltransferase [Aeromonas salmonicida]|uniref:GNAT family N-acetyltransferase n=1 Tax=Aeromonas salmonicida TaxID=645 RepID=UPI0028663181|nr:GNAT family N-acetyltransferase [Aeromonas salmonicida]MDR6995293.1 GNAT superfamily N-acetyltransferase [Aeromonas salmonicida]HEH9413935.1 GNAT family N-acetyltransferase [Aeromonas salmonicida]HEH9415970.1 GNAT family N-acetyltransferase [Aeromonas salmonicida]HEH9421428.1 GNAT family N-acetyltransferase [Aeromonas salmonicida]HEH9424792.1 GNAT family N-acetyltransferase [Aeromonas salmonicida]
MQLTAPQPPDTAEFDALRSGLNQFNETITGPLTRERIASFIKDEEGLVLGGILGEIKWGWLHIEGLWVEDAIRRDGWGARLLATMEQYASDKGITHFHLETTSFQALPFYQKQGYTVFGELPDMPPGHITYFLKKTGQ